MKHKLIYDVSHFASSDKDSFECSHLYILTIGSVSLIHLVFNQFGSAHQIFGNFGQYMRA